MGERHPADLARLRALLPRMPLSGVAEIVGVMDVLLQALRLEFAARKGHRAALDVVRVDPIAGDRLTERAHASLELPT